MTEPLVTTRVIDGKILEITLNKPPVNAIDRKTSESLNVAFRQLQEDESLVVGVVTGTGKLFSAGWDMKAVASATNVEDVAGGSAPGGFGGICEYWDLDKPVIAAVNGHAVGGGFELVLACDLIVAADEAAFWLPEMQRGFLPDAGAIQRLPRMLPYPVALDMFMTGRRMSAAEAKDWGLVLEVTERENVLPRAISIAQQIAEGAPLALRALKATLREIMTMPLRQAMETTKRGKSNIPIYEKMLGSEDAKEGPRAFAEKRDPIWKGK